MATIKSYTDLEQSKKLAEILPIESADMLFQLGEDKYADSIRVPLTKEHWEQMMPDIKPCWSLAALLGILQGTNISTPDPLDKIRYSCWNDYDITYADNPVDACVAMIEKLNELNLL
jgi:hypothetical protein